jgi:hypothetical protein
MFANKFGAAALAAGCIAAAGIGGYAALRENRAPAVAPAAVSTPATASTPSAERPASSAVQETEAVVGDTHADLPAPTPPAHAAAKAVETPASAHKPSTAEPKKPAHNAPASTPTLTHTWPSTAASAPATTASTAPAATSPVVVAPEPEAAPAERTVRQEPPPAPEPPKKTYDELVISADSVIGLQNDITISSDRARVEDRVEARVTRDVKVGDKVAIPAGSHALGVVTQVQTGGKFKERARLGIKFQTIVLADGTRVPISTNTITREGDAPGNASAAKIGGGAVVGTIIGAIAGGGKGAAIGGMAGAGAGAGAVAASDRSVATVRAGETLNVRLQSPVTVTTESR